MNVLAVIVEQLEVDGSLKRLTMNRGAAHKLEVAFPEEFEGERSGPFFFPNKSDEEQFKKEFADSTVLKLSKHHLSLANGGYNLRMQRGGIPTERGQLSYYSLSLPEFAIPTEITLKDPHSSRLLYKSVFRDKQRKRFVIYVECRSRHGVFDFLLDIRFEIEKEKFRDAKYQDDYLSRYGGQIERLLPPDKERTVKRFLSGEEVPAEKGATASSAATGLATDSGTLLRDADDEGDLSDREKRGRDCYRILQEVKNILVLHRRGLRMFEVRQEQPHYQVWKLVPNLSKESQELFEHPNQWGPVVFYTYRLLGELYGNHHTTVRDWVKKYKSRSSAKKKLLPSPALRSTP